MRLTFLGTGTSHGVPMIGCACTVCRSTDPHNKRTRCSVYLEHDGGTILVDTATELRLQVIRAGITSVDALLYTHAHADHIFGLDDVRVFKGRGGGPLPCYATQPVLSQLRQQFFYAFVEGQLGGGKPQLDLRPIDGDRPFTIDGLEIVPVPVLHGGLTVLGYRFGSIAYVTDCNKIEPESLAKLRGLDVLVLDALRYRPHPTHFSIDEALAVVRELQPRQTYFTHLTHDLDHDTTNLALPKGVALAYDGLIVQS